MKNDPSDATARFEEQVRHLLLERITAICVVGCFIFPAYVTEDQTLVPDRWRDLLVARIICSMLCILGMAVGKTALGERHPYGLCVVFTAAISFTKTFATSIGITGIDALYLGGHVLIMVGALSFLPLSGARAAVLGVICTLGYAIPTLVFAEHLNHHAFVIQIGLMLTVTLLLSIGCHLNHRMRFREFDLLQRLHGARRRAEEYG